MPLVEQNGEVSDRAIDLVSPQERHFIAEYLIDLNATRAGKAAGYTGTSCSTWVWESPNCPKPQVARAIKQAMALRAENAGITADMVLMELAKIGFANIRDYLDVSDPDAPRIKLEDVERDKFAALSEVATETVFEERGGGEKAEVRRVRIKMWDKPGALVNIGKHIGMFRQKVDLSVDAQMTINEGGSARDIIKQRLAQLSERSKAAQALAENLGLPALIEGGVEQPEPTE